MISEEINKKVDAVTPLNNHSITVIQTPVKKNVVFEAMGYTAVTLGALTSLWIFPTPKTLEEKNKAITGSKLILAVSGLCTAWNVICAIIHNKRADEIIKQQQGKIFTNQLEQEKLASSQALQNQGRV